MFRRYAYGWITLAFFLVSLLLHWYFGWQDFLNEAQAHGEAPQFSDFSNEMLRETFENWQSEFLQLLWQVLGLAYFLYLGSPASKENDDRMEAKVDALMRMIGGEKAQDVIARLDKHYERHHGVEPHKHGEDYVHVAGLDVTPRR
jgi:hypothetical protein